MITRIVSYGGYTAVGLIGLMCASSVLHIIGMVLLGIGTVLSWFPNCWDTGSGSIP